MRVNIIIILFCALFICLFSISPNAVAQTTNNAETPDVSTESNIAEEQVELDENGEPIEKEAPKETEVNVYATFDEQYLTLFFEKYTELTGIEVNLVTGEATDLIARVNNETGNAEEADESSIADVLLVHGVAYLHWAKTEEALQPTNSRILQEVVPVQHRDAEGHWFGLSRDTLVLAYSRERVEEEWLSTYEDLAVEEWGARLLVNSSSHILNQSFIASMIAHHGLPKAETWAEGLVSNLARKPKGGYTDQIHAIAEAKGDVALIKGSAVAQMITSENEKDQAAMSKVKVFLPNQKDRGLHNNITGIGVTKNAKNIESALALLEFFVSEDAQKIFAQQHHEWPIVESISPSHVLKSWGDLRVDDLSLAKLSEHHAEALALSNRVGWR